MATPPEGRDLIFFFQGTSNQVKGNTCWVSSGLGTNTWDHSDVTSCFLCPQPGVTVTGGVCRSSPRKPPRARGRGGGKASCAVQPSWPLGSDSRSLPVYLPTDLFDHFPPAYFLILAAADGGFWGGGVKSLKEI